MTMREISSNFGFIAELHGYEFIVNICASIFDGEQFIKFTSSVLSMADWCESFAQHLENTLDILP